MQSHLHSAEQIMTQGWAEDALMGNQEHRFPDSGTVYPIDADTILSDWVSPSGSQPVTVTSLSKSLKTKTSFPQTQQSACESKSDLFASSTWPTDPKRIVKGERFAFQLVARFFFLLCRVKSELERLELPSSSSEDSSSSSLSSGELNLSMLVLNAAMERVSDLIVTDFPLLLPLLLPAPVWFFPKMATLEALKPQCVLLVRGEGIIIILVEESVIHIGI
jgi:hypothetical protein